jgi:multiple sugar transport system permease protein
MSSTTSASQKEQGRPSTVESNAPGTPRQRRAGRVRRLTGADRVIVTLMLGVPLLFVAALVWLPAAASVALSFARWEGFGGLDTIDWIGFENYRNIVSNYPPFWPAMWHNVVWVLFLFLIPTPLGMFLAVLCDKEMRGSRFYQTAFYLPVILSLALVGFIWQLIYSRDQGLLNALLGTEIDWYGDPNVNLWAVLVATSWKHTGYIMLIYLAGLKAVDPGLREAAKMDGASETRTYFSVILPVMRPINLIVVVITVIESLRAFDIVWIVNKGRNGLEVIAALVTQNVVGEASRIGFGSALATIMLLISSVYVIIHLRATIRGDR